MVTTPESPLPEFKKSAQPDLRIIYSGEKVEAVPYVTLWEGLASENNCVFTTNVENFETLPIIENMRGDLISFQTKGKTYRDDPKSRLEDFKSQNGQLEFTFQQVKYSDYIVTNMSMEITPPGSQQTIRGLLEPGPHLKSLKESKCSNHLGVSCLVLTSDEKLILQKASSNKITGAGQVTSSASGAMDWKNPPVNPFDIIKAELYEELGLTNEETADVQSFAISRELARGGKPEMFFILKTHLTSDEILNRIGSDPEKEVEKLFAVKIPPDPSERAETLQSLWEDDHTSQSTKAALYYYSRSG